MLLVSTLYMKENWENSFLPEETFIQPFKLLDNSSVNVKMMNAEQNVLYAYLDDMDASVVSLSYAVMNFFFNIFSKSFTIYVI